VTLGLFPGIATIVGLYGVPDGGEGKGEGEDEDG
jgi:hypothetical protein